MNDGQALIPLLGKSSDSPEIESLLRQAGAKPPRLKKGDYNAWASLHKEGIELTFEDEASHFKKKDLAIGEGKLLLVSIRFASAAIPDFTPYAGKLPHGLDFGMSQADLHSRLGKPEWANPNLGRERWAFDGYKLAVGYKDGLTGLEEVSLIRPKP